MILMSSPLFQAGSGKSLRSAIAQDRRLALDDTQGMFLLLGAGYLMAAVILVVELFRYHQAEGRSFRVWLWRPKISASEHWHRLRQLISEYHQRGLFKEELESPTIFTTQLDNEFLYKTYDSRVLNSQFHNVSPLKFHSDTNILQENKVEHRMHLLSLPTLQLNHSDVRKTSSCRDLTYVQTLQKTPMRDVAVSARRMRFGSVGSVLDVKYCQGIWQYEFCWDRPQTSAV